MVRKTLAAVALLAGMAASLLAQAQTQKNDSQAAMTPSQALAILKEGNQRFASGIRASRDFGAQVRATASGQYPFAAIVSCMDSRAPVEILFDQGIGDVFSLR
ncbi:MAG: carbonic anhydrase, partial [Acidobacteriota bacterium]